MCSRITFFYGIVQDQCKEIELHHGMQPRRQIVKQRSQIPLLRNRFADFQQRFQLPARVFRGRGKPVSGAAMTGSGIPSRIASAFARLNRAA